MTKQTRNQRITKTEETEVSKNQPERRITRSMTRNALPINYDLGENMRVTRSLSRENEVLAPNMNKIVKFAKVVGTDDSYIIPKQLKKNGITKINMKDQCGKI